MLVDLVLEKINTKIPVYYYNKVTDCLGLWAAVTRDPFIQQERINLANGKKLHMDEAQNS